MRGYLTEKIKRSIEYEYAAKLEQLKHAMKADHDQALEMARTALVREQAMLSAATSSFGVSHAAAYERRLKAVEELWKGLQALGKQAPAVVIAAEVLRKKDVVNMKFMEFPGRRELVEGLSIESLLGLQRNGESVELMRPFLDEYSWSLFVVYRALLTRTGFMFLEVKEHGAATPHWASDQGIRDLLRSVLDDSEWAEFCALDNLAVSWSRRRIENKMLRHVEAIISGKASAQEAYTQAESIMRAASKLASQEASQSGSASLLSVGDVKT
ncbi:MAG TPA: hypothetical protein VGS03_01940 [Candidatus Polarisedimenticolia bacterium]|jgi:hypothetical protein|nr:hypothetical protein [Candidatus Polarisedimenticolia bacterium]